MAALATTTSSIRRPFACLDGDRLRNLTNIKNRQNANVSPQASSLKRPRPLETHASFDVENLDPDLTFSSKKSKVSTEPVFKPVKPSRMVLKPSPMRTVAVDQVVTPIHLNLHPTSKATVPKPQVRCTTRGRRAGILSRRRVSSSLSAATQPPVSALSDLGSNGLPFSIDSALSGTVPSYVPAIAKATPTAFQESTPKGWLFNIHEDTPEEELGNLVEFSTQILDISDDESKVNDQDQRGKENIPPSDVSLDGHSPHNSVTTTTSIPTVGVSRRDAMTDDVRAPLGELDASSFYAVGCDATSVIMIADERSVVEKGSSAFAFHTMTKDAANILAPVESVTGNQDAWKDLLAKAESSSKGNPSADLQ